MGDERWVENGYLTFDDDGIGAPVLEGTPRYLLLRSLAVDPTESAVGVYDLQAHELRRLFNQPRLVDSGTISVKHHDSAFTTFDPASARVWACGQQTLAVAVATGARTDLPFDCIDFLFIGGGDVVIQSSDGTVYRIAGDSGAAMRLGQIEPFELVAAGRDWFAYTRSGSDDIGSGALSAWIGDERVIAIGVNVRVSADGTRLRWLEDAVADGQVGDLLSRELGSGAVHRLAQNVKHYSELPDGRLVAIANAAIDGAWNRAILIDEAKGESRWLAEGVQRVRVVGEEVIVAREGLDGVDSWLVPLPPR